MFYIKVLKTTEKYLPVKKTKKEKQLRKLKHSLRGGEWSYKNSGSRKILTEFQGSRGLVL